jgi:hypothetical protein
MVALWLAAAKAVKANSAAFSIAEILSANEIDIAGVFRGLRPRPPIQTPIRRPHGAVTAPVGSPPWCGRRMGGPFLGDCRGMWQPWQGGGFGRFQPEAPFSYQDQEPRPLGRAPGYESGGRTFESFRARHIHLE